MHRKGQQKSSANTTIIQCHYHPPGYIRQKWRNRAVLVSLTQQFFQAPFLTNNIYNILKKNEWESVKWFNFTPVQRHNVESAVAKTFATLWMLTIESKIVGISCSLQELLVFVLIFYSRSFSVHGHGVKWTELHFYVQDFWYYEVNDAWRRCNVPIYINSWFELQIAFLW